MEHQARYVNRLFDFAYSNSGLKVASQPNWLAKFHSIFSQYPLNASLCILCVIRLFRSSIFAAPQQANIYISTYVSGKCGISQLPWFESNKAIWRKTPSDLYTNSFTVPTQSIAPKHRKTPLWKTYNGCVSIGRHTHTYLCICNTEKREGRQYLCCLLQTYVSCVFSFGFRYEHIRKPNWWNNDLKLINVMCV